MPRNGALRPIRHHAMPTRLPLKELRSDQCKWPVAEDAQVIGHYLFCARPTLSGEVYCRKHKAICDPGKKSQAQRHRSLLLRRERQ
jgi:hypothetical protein